MFFKVFNGYRPPIPPGMPKGLQDLMTAAWSHNPAERPSYRSIVKMLQRLIREVLIFIFFNLGFRVWNNIKNKRSQPITV